MHIYFSSSVSTCKQVFQQDLFVVLPGIFLSLSFFLPAARSLYLALAPSLFIHNFSTSWSLFSFLA